MSARTVVVILAWLVLLFMFLAGASIAHCQIPRQANQYRATVTRETRLVWGLNAPVSTQAAQLQQESSWKPTANSGMALGLAQFTPGTAAWIAQVYPKQLGDAAPLDPNWAIRALVYYDHRLYGQVPMFQEGLERWAAALSAYNGGLGWVYKDIKLVSCNTTLWFGCVENAVDARTAANQKQNKDYPQRILKLYKPRYDAAGW